MALKYQFRVKQRNKLNNLRTKNARMLLTYIEIIETEVIKKLNQKEKEIEINLRGKLRILRKIRKKQQRERI